MLDVTQILSEIENGDSSASGRLLPLLYDELRSLAAQKLANERPGQTLQATALVHEAYLRLVDVDKAQHWSSRGHFFGAAAEAMRRILVDKARRKNTVKHGGDWARIEIPDIESTTGSKSDNLLALDEALTKLAAEEPEKAELVKLRYFAGLSVEEAAVALGISRTTASRYWTYARVWLFSELSDDEADGEE
jgi:RNA polymerase sigma factor (TIGR02999 family)